MSRICQTLEVSRSNLYEQLDKEREGHKRRVMADDQKILPLIRHLTDERPTYGYRRITALLRKSVGQAINPKRIYRIMKVNNLLLQRHGQRPARVHDGKIITLKSNLRWCSDHFSLQCWNGDQVHVVFALDCHDREILSWINYVVTSFPSAKFLSLALAITMILRINAVKATIFFFPLPMRLL